MRSLLGIALLTVLASSATAETRGEKLFKKGKKLLDEKKYADACATFEEAEKLEPSIVTKLNVGKCFEDWGRLATAFRWYSDAEKFAIDTNEGDRARKIKALAEELDINVPRVTVNVPAGANVAVVATILLDGKPFGAERVGIEQRVDPGPHRIEFTVDGTKKTKMAPVERGGSSEVTLDIPTSTGGAKPPAALHVPSVTAEPLSAAPGRTQRIAGVSLAGAGGVAVGVATILTIGARGRYRDALSAHCMGVKTMCDDDGLQITRDARSRANVATIITVGGAAAIAGGVLLYLLAPDAGPVRGEHAMYVTPTVGAEGSGLALGGRF